jgi:hypothetical protein
VSAPAFHPVADALYISTYDGPASPTAVYWVLFDGSPPSGDLSPADTWNRYVGCYVNVPAGKPVTDHAGFVDAVTSAFGPRRGLAWVADPAAVSKSGAAGFTSASPDGHGGFQTDLDINIDLANISFTATAQSVIAFSPTAAAPATGPALAVGPAPEATGMVGLTRAGGSINMASDGGLAFIALSGAAAGTIVFPATWNRWELYRFFAAQKGRFATPAGVEIQYFYGPNGSEQTLRYPVFPGDGNGTDPTQDLALNVSLDPFEVWDPARTLLGLDLGRFGGGGPVLPIGTTFAATDGSTVELVPQPGAGMAFGRRPQGSSTEPAEAYAYLTPSGVFAVRKPTGPPIRHLMCGLTATEYLLVAPGATVEFVPGGKAYSSVFAPATPGHAVDPCTATPTGKLLDPDELLQDAYTTAWVRVDSPAPTPLIDHGYAMQPEAQVLHATGADTKYTYPLAVGCLISTLQNGKTLPVAPYLGVWSTGAESLPSADLLRAFESQIIAGARFATAPKDEDNGPTLFDATTHTGLTGSAMTPMGLLLSLNGEPQTGTFAKLLLGQSATVDGNPELSLSGSAVMAPDVSYALANANLFMPITDKVPLRTFANEAVLGEWTFQLDVDSARWSDDLTSYSGTILLFKLTTTATVAELVADAGYWQGWQTFIDRDPARAAKKVATLQTQLNEAFCQAQRAGPGSMFGDFLEKIDNASWTGILAMDCGIDAAKLPIDLQDLLGGITGELRAHHFGITVNRIHGEKSSDWVMQASSLFALIYYDADYKVRSPSFDPPFDFQVLKLHVQFENSAQVGFESRIAVTVPELFGTDVVLKESPVSGENVIEIDGAYQKHGESGTVVFRSGSPFSFAIKTSDTGFRAIDSVHLTEAALVPLTSTASDKGTIEVTSRFVMAGLLDFAPAVNPGRGTDDQPLDLFSYGTVDPSLTGLKFSGYDLEMTTCIPANQGQLTGIVPKLDQFAVAPEASTPRMPSLVQALPLKVSGLIQTPSSEGWDVQFQGRSGRSFAGDFALEMKGSLGSLGSLASAGLDIDLVIAWQAARGADDDQLWLQMVPPKGMLGTLAFGIQDVMWTTFDPVELVSASWSDGTDDHTVYGLYFKNVESWLLGIPLIPGVSDFTLFASPTEGANSNIGWLMTSTAGVVP